MGKESRQRMVVGAAALLGSRGLSATSLNDVLERSRAPRGSIYHNFPEGKRQLVGEALRWTTEQILLYQSRCTATTASGVLDHFLEVFRRSVESSKCQAGCPLAGVVVDTYSSDAVILGLCRAGFRSWTTLLSAQLVRAGVPRRRAHSLATLALASIEGALILCRTERSPRPLEEVASQLRQLSKTPRAVSGTTVHKRRPRSG